MHEAERELTDETLQGEIELVADLFVAAAAHDGPMSDEELDAALGVNPPRGCQDTGPATPDQLARGA